MKKQFLGLGMIFLLTVQTAYGFCTWGFVPPERAYEPVDATEVFIHYTEGEQTMVLQPQFRGNAEEFGIIYPTPNRPTITEGPKDLFQQLENATNPWIQPEIMFAAAQHVALDSVEQKTVTVIEEKTVGDYDVAVLTATNENDLVDWLQENDYQFGESDSEKIAYYVNQKNFYFIALKVNMKEWSHPWATWKSIPDDNITSDERIAFTSPPLWFGELSPLEISFKTDKPQLPMRTLQSNMPTMTFDLYTVGDTPWYVPAVDTIYADIIDKDFIKQVGDLAAYNTQGKWIVRQEVKFNPSKSTQDLYLTQGDTNMKTVDPNNQVRLSPSGLDPDTGIIPGTRGTVVVERATNYRFTRSLAVGSRGEDVRALQVLLNQYGFAVSQTGPGSVGQESIYFGTKTKQALIRFQNFYRTDILTPVGLNVGTGYFGPSTIKFLDK